MFGLNMSSLFQNWDKFGFLRRKLYEAKYYKTENYLKKIGFYTSFGYKKLLFIPKKVHIKE